MQNKLSNSYPEAYRNGFVAHEHRKTRFRNECKMLRNPIPNCNIARK